MTLQVSLYAAQADTHACGDPMRMHSSPHRGLHAQRMLCTCMGAYLIASRKQKVEDAGVLIAQEVLPKFLVLLIKLHTIPTKHPPLSLLDLCRACC